MRLLSMASCLLILLSTVPLEARAAEPTPEPSALPGADLEPGFSEGIDQLVRLGGELEWGPCPPGPLDASGCAMAVLEGNPRAEELFTFRVRIEGPFVLPPHTHPRHERVTVIDGVVHVGFGEQVDKSASRRFEAGDFYVNRSGAAHFVWSDEPTTVQLTGFGPWGIHPLASDPGSE